MRRAGEVVEREQRIVRPDRFLLEDDSGEIRLITCPPWYRFLFYGRGEQVRVVGHLVPRIRLDLPPGLTRAEVLDAIEGHVIGQGDMVPIYQRQQMGPPPWN